MLLPFFSVILIHSSPLDEVAQNTPHFPGLENEQTVVARQFVFTGNVAIPTKRLERITAPYLGKSVSEIDLETLEERLEALYRAHGYKKVKVSVSSASHDGVITFHIVEGKKGPSAG